MTKPMLAAAVTAGCELAKVEQELGADFDEFITSKTPWNVMEARTLISFAARGRLARPDGLTPAVAVPLSQVFEAVAHIG